MLHIFQQRIKLFNRQCFFRFIYGLFSFTLDGPFYINRLRMAWTSLRISLAERQILSAPTTIFLLKNSGMGFADVPLDNTEAPIQTDPNRPEWAYGMSESEYAAASRKRIADIIAALPEPDGLDDIPPASYGLAEKYLLHHDDVDQDERG